MKKKSIPEFVFLISLFIVLYKLGKFYPYRNPYETTKSNNKLDSIRGLNVKIYEDDDLVKWEALLQLWDKEMDRFWTRSNIFLVVNGALLVAVTSFTSLSIIGAAVSLFGMIFISIWIKVNRIGKYYVDRWKYFLQEIEIEWDKKIVGNLDKMTRESAYASRYRSTTRYMLITLRIMFFLWLVIFVQFIIQFINENSILLCQIINGIMDWISIIK